MNLETGEPLDDLTEPAKTWCKQHGTEINTVSEFLEKKDKKLMKAIQDGVDRYNSRSVSRAQKVRVSTISHAIVHTAKNMCKFYTKFLSSVCITASRSYV